MTRIFFLRGRVWGSIRVHLLWVHLCFSSNVLHGSPHTAAQKQDDQHERTFSSCVRIQDVVLKTCLGRWTIGRSGERGSGISVLPARYDDDDEVTRKTSGSIRTSRQWRSAIKGDGTNIWRKTTSVTLNEIDLRLSTNESASSTNSYQNI